jgi:hypothetical protein
MILFHFLIIFDAEYLGTLGKSFGLSILYLNISLLSYGFSQIQTNFGRLNESQNDKKSNIFHTEVQSDNEKRSSVTQKSKFDIDFLGCVECSTNGNLLGEIIIFVPPLGSVDAKAGGEINWF